MTPLKNVLLKKAPTLYSPYKVYKWSKKPQGFGEPRLRQGIWIHGFVWGGPAVSDS